MKEGNVKSLKLLHKTFQNIYSEWMARWFFIPGKIYPQNAKFLYKILCVYEDALRQTSQES